MALLHTRSGRPIGFRRSRSPWQQDLSALLAFAREASYGFVDYGPIDAATARQALSPGPAIGTVDLLDWTSLVSPDAGRRSAAVITNASHIRSLAALGVMKFLTVIAPANPEVSRKDNFGFAVESYRSLAKAAAECGATILIEGAPGRPPHFANLACTPADLRAFLQAIDSSAVGVNFDPSHLVRMGIDPEQFVREFAGRIGHVHAKDTLFLPDDRYEHGTLQEATFASAHAYGGHAWRYALPGRGAVPWTRLLSMIGEGGYNGGISIELEDADYLGDAAKEQLGLRQAAEFLTRV